MIILGVKRCIQYSCSTWPVLTASLVSTVLFGWARSDCESPPHRENASGYWSHRCVEVQSKKGMQSRVVVAVWSTQDALPRIKFTSVCVDCFSNCKHSQRQTTTAGKYVSRSDHGVMELAETRGSKGPGGIDDHDSIAGRSLN